MARIRTIKPDALLHRKVGRLSHLGFRVWIGQITQADDEGRFIADASEIRARVFGYHPEVSIEDTEAAIQEVAADGLTRLYSVNGTRYGVFPSWGDHQKIDRPSPSRLPAPPSSDATSLNHHGALDEGSTNARRTLDEGSTRKGKGIGKGKNLTGDSAPVGGLERPARKQKPTDPNVNLVIDAYHRAYLATHGTPPPINGAKSGAIAKKLLAGRQPAEAVWMVVEFFKNPPQFYANKNLWGMEHILAASTTLLARSTRPKP